MGGTVSLPGDPGLLRRGPVKKDGSGSGAGPAAAADRPAGTRTDDHFRMLRYAGGKDRPLSGSRASTTTRAGVGLHRPAPRDLAAERAEAGWTVVRMKNAVVRVHRSELDRVVARVDRRTCGRAEDLAESGAMSRLILTWLPGYDRGDCASTVHRGAATIWGLMSRR